MSRGQKCLGTKRTKDKKSWGLKLLGTKCPGNALVLGQNIMEMKGLQELEGIKVFVH